MEDQLRSAVQAAGVGSVESVERKAAELLRIMHVKVPSGTLRKGEICRHVLAVDLACRSLHVAYSAKKLIQISAVPEQAYSQALRICRDMLQLKVGEITIDRLAVIFNGDSVRRDAYAVLQLYRDKYLATLSTAQRQHVDLNSSAYQAAAFMIAAKDKKLKVDKKALLDAAQVDPGIFRNVCNSILRHITVTSSNGTSLTSSTSSTTSSEDAMDECSAAEGTAASSTRSSSKQRIVIKTTTERPQSPAAEGVTETPAKPASPTQSIAAFGHQRQAHTHEGDPQLLQPSAVRKLLASMTPTALDFQSSDAFRSSSSSSSRQSPPSVAALLTPEHLQQPPEPEQPSSAMQAVTAGGRKPKRSLADFERMKEVIRSKRQNSSPEQPASVEEAAL